MLVGTPRRPHIEHHARIAGSHLPTSPDFMFPDRPTCAGHVNRTFLTSRPPPGG